VKRHTAHISAPNIFLCTFFANIGKLNQVSLLTNAREGTVQTWPVCGLTLLTFFALFRSYEELCPWRLNFSSAWFRISGHDFSFSCFFQLIISCYLIIRRCDVGDMTISLCKPQSNIINEQCHVYSERHNSFQHACQLESWVGIESKTFVVRQDDRVII
jgi:hypothetical protein